MRHSMRRGMTVPELFALLGLLGLAIFIMVGALGSATRDSLDSRMNHESSMLGSQGEAAKAKNNGP